MSPAEKHLRLRTMPLHDLKRDLECHYGVGHSVLLSQDNAGLKGPREGRLLLPDS